MKKKIDSAGAAKRRKFLVMLPVLVLPFIAMLFWALGGGQGGTAMAKGTDSNKFNTNLPDAKIADEPLDKMSYYDKAMADSAKRRELLKNDPNVQPSDQPEIGRGDTGSPVPQLHYDAYAGNNTGYSRAYQDPNEAKVYDQLSRLNATINQPPPAQPTYQSVGVAGRLATIKAADIDRLESMMKSMSQKTEEDPEMKQLNGMLESILDIQHPNRVQERLKNLSVERKGQVFPVSTRKRALSVSVLDKQSTASVAGNGFYSLEEPATTIDSANAVKAVIHETQTIINGSTVKLRLLDDVYINGTLIPKDNFLYGTAALNGERLTIKIESIRYKSGLYPVELAVFDLDGLDGIYIPGAISRDVAKESKDRGLQGIGFSTLDPSIGMQAASVGVEAAKSFLSKKVKLIRVTVKAGYQVLLRDEKQKLQQ